MRGARSSHEDKTATHSSQSMSRHTSVVEPKSAANSIVLDRPGVQLAHVAFFVLQVYIVNGASTAVLEDLSARAISSNRCRDRHRIQLPPTRGKSSTASSCLHMSGSTLWRCSRFVHHGPLLAEVVERYCGMHSSIAPNWPAPSYS